MKVFRYKQFETKSVEAAFRARVRKEGILRRRDLETLEVSPVFMRPFRRVLWTLMNDSGRYSSFVDENIVSAVSDPDESLLLWRPNYAGLPTGEESDDHITLGDVVRQTVLEEALAGFVERRRGAQETLAELEPKIRELQIDRRQAVQLLVPRTTLAGRKESQVVKERLPPHSVVIATSMVSNCANDSVITGATLGERVFVPTIIGMYHNLISRDLRLEFMEMAGADSTADSLRNGGALTRLASINTKALESFRVRFE
ncbi:MAG: hypothetical protein ACW99U_12280 [Candidatus Thorarchaeota archaeon]